MKVSGKSIAAIVALVVVGAAAVAIGSGGEVRWSDDVDLCPDALYMEIASKRADEIVPNLNKASVDA